jgi:hypothetical protein
MGVLRIKNSENDRHLGLGFLLNGRGRVIFEFHLAQRCEINQSLVGAIKILKNMSSSMGRIMENKKCLKPPTRIILVQRPINWDMGPQNVSYSDLFSSFEFQLISQHTPFLIRSVGGSQFYFFFFVSTLQKYQSIGNHDQVEKNETTNIDQPALLSKHSSFIQFLGCSIQLTNVHT